MESGLSLLTLEWLLMHGTIGIAIGYSLRIFEHFSWAVGESDWNLSRNIRWAITFLPESVVMGAGFGYVTIAVLALFIKDRVVIQVATYVVTCLIAFLARDLREFLRRLKRL